MLCCRNCYLLVSMAALVSIDWLDKDIVLRLYDDPESALRSIFDGLFRFAADFTLLLATIFVSTI